jgi:long-subunit fatty acid transport protein
MKPNMNRSGWFGLICIGAVVALGIFGLDQVDADTIFQQVGIASAPVPVGSGARAMGMGGAFIAVSDDATAASWNPAGLIQLERPEFSVVGAYDGRLSRYTSQSHPEIDGTHYDAVTSPNYVSAVLPFHWHRNLVVSLNIQRLFDFERSFTHDFHSTSAGLDLARKIEFEQDGALWAMGLAGAVQLTPNVSVGLTVNVWTDELGWDNEWRSHYQANTSGTQAGVPVSDETVIDERYEKFRGISFNLGILWEAGGLGTLGAVIKTPFKASLVHRYHYASTSIADSIEFTEDAALYMPLSYGIGWSRRFSDQFTLSLDLHRTHWQDYRLTDSQDNSFSPIDGRPTSQSDVDPTTHVRLGGEYVIILPKKSTALPLRAGLFYDPEPSEGGSRDYYGIALGAGFTRRQYSIDLAYQLRWGNDIDTGNLIATSKADIIQHRVLASLIYYF